MKEQEIDIKLEIYKTLNEFLPLEDEITNLIQQKGYLIFKKT